MSNWAAVELLEALADACGFSEKEEAEPEAPHSIQVVCPRDGLPAIARLWAGAYLCDVCGERDHERRGV